MADSIERGAAAQALLIREAFSYSAVTTLLGDSAAARNRYCDANFVPL